MLRIRRSDGAEVRKLVSLPTRAATIARKLFGQRPGGGYQRVTLTKSQRAPRSRMGSSLSQRPPGQRSASQAHRELTRLIRRGRCA